MRYRILTLSTCAAVLIAVCTAPAEAQRRHHRGRHQVTVIQRSPLLFGGSFYSGFYHPYYAGFGPWSPYGYPVYGPFPGHYPGVHTVALRLQVTPREATVYVDGFVAGVVDDYDGVFQRLRVSPGHHEIVVYHAGYRTLRQNLYFNPGSAHTIRDTLVPLSPGEAPEPEPAPRAPAAVTPGHAAPSAAESARMGTLALRVQPGDASIFIDDEPWRFAAKQERFVVQLAEGTHRLRVEKPGLQTFAVDVDVRDGETTILNVSLVP